MWCEHGTLGCLAQGPHEPEDCVGLDGTPSLVRDGTPPAPFFETGAMCPLADLEKRYILHVLAHFSGQRTQTARALGIGTNTLWRKLTKWGIPPRYRRSGPTTQGEHRCPEKSR